MLFRTAVSSSVILLAVGMATVFAWIATLSGVPKLLTAFLFEYTDNKYTVLLMINLLLLIIGMFLDAGPAILILGPILTPTALAVVSTLFILLSSCVNLP